MDNGQFYSALGVVWVFGFATVLLVAWHLRRKRQLETLNIIHAERMKAMEKGIPLPELPDLEDSARTHGRSGMSTRDWNPRWPLGAGVLLIMGGIGTAVAMMMSGWEFHHDLWPFALIPVFMGVGMFLFYTLTRTTSDGA